MHVFDDQQLKRHWWSLVRHIVIAGLPELGGRGIQGKERGEMVGDMILRRMSNTPDLWLKTGVHGPSMIEGDMMILVVLLQ